MNMYLIIKEIKRRIKVNRYLTKWYNTNSNFEDFTYERFVCSKEPITKKEFFNKYKSWVN